MRVDTLIMLRWFAIIGQTIALLYVYLLFAIRFPDRSVLRRHRDLGRAQRRAARSARRARFRLDDSEAAVLLAYDILQLAALLYLTGGVANRFAMLFLAPVMISAVSLPRKLTLFCSAC